MIGSKELDIGQRVWGPPLFWVAVVGENLRLLCKQLRVFEARHELHTVAGDFSLHSIWNAAHSGSKKLRKLRIALACINAIASFEKCTRNGVCELKARTLLVGEDE